MALIRKRRPWWLAAAFLIAATNFASAQNQGTFVFSSDPDKVIDPKGSLAARPNTPEARYLFVKNPKGDPATYIVELRDGKGRTVLASGKIELEKNQQARVKLEKTPPPAPPKGVVPAVAVAPPAPAAPPAPEPPPGIELKRDGEAGVHLLLRLLDDQGKPVLDNQKKPIVSDVPVELRLPLSYIEDPAITITRTNDAPKLDATVKSMTTFSGPPAVVDLAFPPQASLRAEALRSGSYRRVINGPEQTVKLQANDLPIVDGPEERVRFSIGVDGYARAFIYEPDFRRPSDQAVLTRVRTPAVRILPLGADRPLLTMSAKPADKYPLRLEVDNASPASKLVVRLDRSGTGVFGESDESTTLPSTREEMVFLDPQGETEAIVVNYRVSDWVYNLDTRALRGKHELQAVLKNGDKEEAKYSCYLILDDTPPESIAFGELPAKHVKGTPLPLKASAHDPETSIKQAIFFLGAPLPDGKLPDVKVEGTPIDASIGLWGAELPIPDKKGTIEVGVMFVNETGLPALKMQKIELIDPPAPGGTIEGTVELGSRGQPKVPVSLRDAEGKEKGVAVTDDKGAFKFEGVAPGTYRLYSAKPDSGVGTKGDVPAQVVVGKTVKVTISLARKP